MRTVYALSDKGQRERAAERPTLPAELAQLLQMVDGQRTREELLAAAGRNALTAGGLRWLTDTGYVLPTVLATLHRPPTAPGTLPSAAGAPASRDAGVFLPVPTRSEADVCRALSDFMVRAIRRHLGEGGYPHRRQVERATEVGALLPHLNPLIDTILLCAGHEAAAEFADTAAFILHPLERDGLLN